VKFSSLPTSTGLSSFFITVEIANSDCSSEGEYISAVILGGQTPGRDYLKLDGAVNQCNKLSKILDLKVPMDTVSSAGELMSADKSCVDLGGDWSNTHCTCPPCHTARVNSLCDKTGKYSTVHQPTIKPTCGGSGETGTMQVSTTVGDVARSHTGRRSAASTVGLQKLITDLDTRNGHKGGL
jgi:hypothetical protein